MALFVLPNLLDRPGMKSGPRAPEVGYILPWITPCMPGFDCPRKHLPQRFDPSISGLRPFRLAVPAFADVLGLHQAVARRPHPRRARIIRVQWLFAQRIKDQAPRMLRAVFKAPEFC